MGKFDCKKNHIAWKSSQVSKLDTSPPHTLPNLLERLSLWGAKRFWLHSQLETYWFGRSLFLPSNLSLVLSFLPDYRLPMFIGNVDPWIYHAIRAMEKFRHIFLVLDQNLIFLHFSQLGLWMPFRRNFAADIGSNNAVLSCNFLCVQLVYVTRSFFNHWNILLWCQNLKRICKNWPKCLPSWIFSVDHYMAFPSFREIPGMWNSISFFPASPS